MKSIMWKYMDEETFYLKRLLNCDLSAAEKLKDSQVLYFVAHGSSFNAASTVANLVSRLCKIRTYVYNPSSFINDCESIHLEDKEHTWVCLISQTGTSSGVMRAGEKVKQLGLKSFAITDTQNSPIESFSNLTFYLNVEDEKSNAKTKGYSATLLLIELLGINIAYFKGLLKDDDKKQYLHELNEEIDNLSFIQKKALQWCEQHHYGNKMNHLYVIGNGSNHASAMEGMLKLMETMCIPTMYSDIEEFSHGMHRSVNENSYVILLIDHIDTSKMKETYRYLVDKKVHTLVISTNEKLDVENEVYIGKEYFDSSVLLLVSVLQVISAYVPELHGLDPNRESNDDYTKYMKTRI